MNITKREAQYIDITRPIHPGMAIYPGNPSVEFKEVSSASPSTSGLTKIVLGSHTGTHIDAPSHIIEGAAGISTFSLDQLNGPVEVIDISSVETVITADDLPKNSKERVLFKTRNSQGDSNVFDEGFVALAEDAAEELVKRGVKLVGIDALSIKKKGVKDRVHAIFIDAGIVIVEGLWFADVKAGMYELLCLPLNVDLDGAPVRAVLRTL